MRDPASVSILRTLAFHEAWSYAPTRAELFATLEAEEDLRMEDASRAFERLRAEGEVVERRGRCGFPSSVSRIVDDIERRDALQPRKRRRAARVAWLLSHFAGIRFIALANTTALGAARDFGDLDFFIIVRSGSLWTTRLLAALPAKLFRLQPRGDEIRDAVCFSYFISDDGLDLSAHQLRPDDPYFRYWFLSLLPLFDDGISEDLWRANGGIRRRHPLAQKWIPSSDLRAPVPRFRWPVLRHVERIARLFQIRRLPEPVQARMNRDVRVIVDDRTLKLHVTDGRAAFRDVYLSRCAELGIL